MKRLFATAVAGSLILGIAAFIGAQTANLNPAFSAGSDQTAIGSIATTASFGKNLTGLSRDHVAFKAGRLNTFGTAGSAQFAAAGNDKNWLQGGGG